MIPLAHVAGVPAEELLPALAGAGGLLLLARGWVALHLRRNGRSHARVFGAPDLGERPRDDVEGTRDRWAD